jgi:hypothetical protein
VRRAVLFFLLGGTLAAQGSDYVATLVFGTVKLRLALHLNERATLDSLDQDAFDLPLESVLRSGNRLSFRAPRPGGRFEGMFTADGRAIEGTWTQRGGALPLRFERGNPRPQEPRPPYAYESEEVAIRTGAARLAGTLTLPRGGGPYPAVVLITGSGPQDRNDTASGHRPFLVWADYLTRRGFAVLRTDDRGVGGSAGRLLDSTEEDLAGDVLAQVSFLRGRREIDARRIGLMGHSEGAVVGPIAAARSKDVAFLVLLAGPAIPGEQILFAQAERVARVLGAPEEVARQRREVEEKLVALARAGASAAQLRKALPGATQQFGRQIDVAASRWFRFILDYDPRPVLQRLGCPVLALYGGVDLQVPADLNAPEMRKALGRGDVRTLAGLNHMFQHATTGSPLEYAQIEETVAPEALEEVIAWLSARAAEGEARGCGQ